MQILVVLIDSLELTQARFGQELTNILINSEETATYLAKKFGVPDTLVRDLEERKQIIRVAQQMQSAMQNQQGMMPNEQTNQN